MGPATVDVFSRKTCIEELCVLLPGFPAPTTNGARLNFSEGSRNVHCDLQKQIKLFHGSSKTAK